MPSKKNTKHMHTPCNNCPFLVDEKTKGWLGEERAKSITQDQSFICHKTTGGKDEDRKQCAGHLIVCQDVSAFYAVARFLGINLKLTGHEKVFKIKKDFIEHHKNK
jgi:Family of unknown function (DUF6283)